MRDRNLSIYMYIYSRGPWPTVNTVSGMVVVVAGGGGGGEGRGGGGGGVFRM